MRQDALSHVVKLVGFDDHKVVLRICGGGVAEQPEERVAEPAVDFRVRVVAVLHCHSRTDRRELQSRRCPRIPDLQVQARQLELRGIRIFQRVGKAEKQRVDREDQRAAHGLADVVFNPFRFLFAHHLFVLSSFCLR